MPFGIINYRKFNPYSFVKLTKEEQQLKEEYITKLYNLKKPHNKISLDNLNHHYLTHDCIDKCGKKYEIKSVNHQYGKFMGEYLSIFKLGQCNCKGLRIIYHYLNDDIYYIDYSATAFKKKWFKNSNKQGMVYIPIEALKKA